MPKPKIKIIKQQIIADETFSLTVELNYEKGSIVKTFNWPVTETKAEIKRQLEDCIYPQYDPEKKNLKDEIIEDLDW